MSFFLLFLISFIAGSFFPLGSEFYLLYLVNEGYSKILLLLSASLGNTIGGMSCYYIAKFGGRPLIRKILKFNDEKVSLWVTRLENKTEFVALFCWLPFVGELIATAIGLLSDKSFRVFLYMFLGKFFRYVVIIWGIESSL